MVVQMWYYIRVERQKTQTVHREENKTMREFSVKVTESKANRIKKYLNEMQDSLEKARDNDNERAYLTSMAYRDGAIRMLTELGIDFDFDKVIEIESKSYYRFGRIKKNIYKD
jgi:hypothetical protein